jgi:hypothetical protein
MEEKNQKLEGDEWLDENGYRVTEPAAIPFAEDEFGEAAILGDDTDYSDNGTLFDESDTEHHAEDMVMHEEVVHPGEEYISQGPGHKTKE